MLIIRNPRKIVLVIIKAPILHTSGSEDGHSGRSGILSTGATASWSSRRRCMRRPLPSHLSLAHSFGVGLGC